MKIVHEAVIEAPVDVVWDLTENVESWPSLSSTFTSVERLTGGPLRAGSLVRVKQPGQAEQVWTVTIIDRPNLFAWEAHLAGLRMIGSHQISHAGTGCRNRLAVELSGRGANLVGRLIGGRIRRSIATENAGFKRRAEADPHRA